MKVLILTSEIYSTWIWNLIKNIKEHDIHCYYADEPYPFSAIKSYDVGISFMYTHKVPAKEVNSHTWFNFHPAPLPEYKGRNLCYHAIMNGEKEFGATIHYMDENFDTGDIIHVQRFPIWNFWTALDLSAMTINVSKYLFAEFLPRVLAGEEFERHPNEGGTYYPKFDISDEVALEDEEQRKILAIYYPPHYPKIEIGGVTYKIVREE